jgi:hypothetical protein
MNLRKSLSVFGVIVLLAGVLVSQGFAWQSSTGSQSGSSSGEYQDNRQSGSGSDYSMQPGSGSTVPGQSTTPAQTTDRSSSGAVWLIPGLIVGLAIGYFVGSRRLRPPAQREDRLDRAA